MTQFQKRYVSNPEYPNHLWDTFQKCWVPKAEALEKGNGQDAAPLPPKPKMVIEWFDNGEGLAEGVSLDDFRAYMPMHSYIFTPSREMWPAASVNAKIPPITGNEAKPVSASAWLDKNKSVEQMTWAPGEPMLIPDRLISDGGWIDRPGVTCFNLYRPPIIKLGNADDVGPWLTHAGNVFQDHANHVIKWLAHRVQCPQEKINHALVLGGNQGIGKDTLLEPVKYAIGPWNFAEVSPTQIMGRFNSFLKSVILRVSEARDLGDIDRFKFYDHMKAYTAAPPDVLRVDEKHLREHAVFNCCGVIITSNHKTDGIYLPPDDRRHYVAWSDAVKDDFAQEYWNGLWDWYARGGFANVVAYLAKLDISSFDPKAPPPKDPGILGYRRRQPRARGRRTRRRARHHEKSRRHNLKPHHHRSSRRILAWLCDRKNRRAIPHRLEECGYVPVRNNTAESGLWVINGIRQVIYGKKTLPVRDRFKAARDLVSPHS